MSKTRRDPSSSSSRKPTVEYIPPTPQQRPQNRPPREGMRCVIDDKIANVLCWCDNHFCADCWAAHQEENKAHLVTWHYTPIKRGS